MSTTNQAFDDDTRNGTDEQSSTAGRQGATSRSTNQQMHPTRSGGQSSASEQRKVVDETDSDQRNVTEIRAVRTRHRSDDEDPPITPAGIPAAQVSGHAVAGLARQLPPVPPGVKDELGGEVSERGNTILTQNSITSEHIRVLGRAVETANDAMTLANETAQSDPKATQVLLKNANSMLDIAEAAIVGARNSHLAARAAELRHQQEAILADQLRLMGVRAACADLCDSAQRTEELSEPAKQQAVTLWERADVGLQTLGGGLGRGVVEVRVEIPVSAIAHVAQESALLIEQALTHVGTYLGYIWELVKQLAEHALVRMAWIQHQALLGPFVPHLGY